MQTLGFIVNGLVGLLAICDVGAQVASASARPFVPPLFRHEGVVHTVARFAAAEALRAGDVDGDGDVDFVFANSSLRYVAFTILVNDGEERFQERRIASTKISPGGRESRLVDLDYDGDLDVVLVTTEAPGLELWENDGKGGFALGNGKRYRVPAFSRPNSSLPAAYALAVGDVEGDGDVDILVGRFYKPCVLLLNNGLGVFTVAKALSALPSRVLMYDVAMGDVNRDGVADMLFCDTLNNPELWVSGRGGTYSRAVVFASYQSHESTIVDMNGDGSADVIMQDYPNARTHVFLGDGKGGMKLSRTFGSPLSSHAAVDYDADGDLDMFFAVPAGGRVFRNDGSMRFVETTQGDLPPLGRGPALHPVDFDGDGDMDLAGWEPVPNSPKRHLILMRNRTRDVWAPREVRIGEVLGIDLSARKGSQMVLGIAGRRAFSSTSWGSLFLDPSTTIVLPPVQIVSRHPAQIRLSVPPLGSLAGRTLNLQGLEVRGPNRSELRLTNLKATRIVR